MRATTLPDQGTWSRGVTLVELLIVLAVIAVLSGAAISLLANAHSQSAIEEAANRIAADIALFVALSLPVMSTVS